MTILLPHAFGLHTPAGGAASLSFIGSTTSTGATITPHASAAAGDWAILMECGRTNPTMTSPTGWTKLIEENASNLDRVCHYKTLVSGDLSTGVGAYATGTMHKIMLVFRPSGGSISSVTVNDLTSDIASEPAQQTISAAAGSAPLISFATVVWNGASAPTPTLSTNSESLTEVATAECMLAYKIYNSSPADADVDCTGTSLTFNEFLASWFVEFTIS